MSKGERISNKEYRSREGVSSSDLKKIMKSPAHFRHWKDNPDITDTPSLLFGRAAHKYILETYDFYNEFAIAPICDRRTKEGKEKWNKFVSESDGKDVITQEQFEFLSNTIPVYANMAYYLHLSLLLTFATTNPDSPFLIFFIIPIKAWVIGLVYLAMVLASVFNLSYPVLYFPHNLFPLVALANYLLFMGSDIKNLLPLSWRIKRKRKTAQKREPIPFRPAEQKRPDYSHRCTVCGRTDISNPELEFRYCSRCSGYHCYCSDHISSHTHITE